MRVIRGITIAVLASAAVWGQSAPASLEFEVASIRPSGPIIPGQLGVGLHIDGAQVRCSYFALSDYLGIAYKLKNYQITGPDWIKSERFDINAKMPEGATREQVSEMMRTLLESRFQLKMHRETKPFPVYALVAAKGGLKIKELPPDAADSEADKAGSDVKAAGSKDGVSVSLGKGSSFSIGNNKVVAKKLTMTALADLLSRFEDRPVVDMTELKGNYDITIEVTPEDFRAMTIRSAIAAGVQLPPEALRLLDAASDSSLHTALQDLGLKLDTRKAPIEMLVIDHAEKSPTEN
jgi:uncharacterized protein (TIGR03435 family)